MWQAEDPEIDRFYGAQYRRLRNFVARRVSGPEDAEDVCQEIWQTFFVRYDEYVATYEEPAKVLYPIARVRIADYWRRRGRIQEEPVEGEDLVLLADSLASWMGDHQGTDSRIDLERALADLPSRQREALHLRYVDDLTLVQTAALMGVSDNAVKNLRGKAVETLRKCVSMDSYRPEGEDE